MWVTRHPMRPVRLLLTAVCTAIASLWAGRRGVGVGACLVCGISLVAFCFRLPLIAICWIFNTIVKSNVRCCRYFVQVCWLILSVGRCTLISQNNWVKKVGEPHVPVDHRGWWRQSCSPFYTISPYESFSAALGNDCRLCWSWGRTSLGGTNFITNVGETLPRANWAGYFWQSCCSGSSHLTCVQLWLSPALFLGSVAHFPSRIHPFSIWGERAEPEGVACFSSVWGEGAHCPVPRDCPLGVLGRQQCNCLMETVDASDIPLLPSVLPPATGMVRQ